MVTMNRTVTPRATNKMCPNYLWSKIRNYCDTYNITRTELAKVTGKSTATISSYKSKPENVSLDVIYKFCNRYNIQNLSDLENF